MSNLAAIREQAINIAKQACEEDRKENYGPALQLYEKAIKLFMHVIRYDTNPKLVETLRGKTTEYLDRAEKIRDFLKGTSIHFFIQVYPSSMRARGTFFHECGRESLQDTSSVLPPKEMFAFIVYSPNSLRLTRRDEAT